MIFFNKKKDLEPGMLTPKYSGPFNGLKICLKEEGIKGIYRGFGGYFVVV